MLVLCLGVCAVDLVVVVGGGLGLQPSSALRIRPSCGESPFLVLESPRSAVLEIGTRCSTGVALMLAAGRFGACAAAPPALRAFVSDATHMRPWLRSARLLRRAWRRAPRCAPRRTRPGEEPGGAWRIARWPTGESPPIWADSIESQPTGGHHGPVGSTGFFFSTPNSHGIDSTG